MKLLTYQPEIKTAKEFPGLISCEFKHKIQTAEATLNYLGPTIDAPVWDEICSFFQWTYDTTHSESQVRLFANTKDKVWDAWAFPQEARTGMSAKELDTPEAKEQRAQFKDSDGWIYFGTVHHHCSAGAFQSGTDKANEQNTDGLHITIGNMASARYDMHARFYLGGFCFEPDMSRFWDIGEEVTNLVPPDCWDRVARHQMCAKAQPTGFPDQWKLNLIEVKQTFPCSSQETRQEAWGLGYRYTGGAATGGGNGSGSPHPIQKWLRARKAVGELAADLLKNPWNKKDQATLAEWIHNLATGANDDLSSLANVMRKWDVDLMDMWSEIPANEILDECIQAYKAELTASAQQEAARKQLEDQWDHGMMG